MSKIKENSALAREKTINKIIETALKLFAENGFASTSIRTISKEAGISLGLMYNYFSGKDELLREIIKRGFAQIKESMLPYSEETDARTTIHNHISLSLEIAKKNRELWLLINSLRHQNEVVKQMQPEIDAVNHYILSTLEKSFKKLLYKNARHEAYLLFAVVDGIVNHYLMMGEDYPAQEILDLLKSKYK